jgi:hypothetical protein
MPTTSMPTAAASGWPSRGPSRGRGRGRRPCARRAPWPAWRLLGGQLGGEGGGLARALEADVAGRGPGEHVALGVGDRDDGVVERALDVGHAVGDVLALACGGAARPAWRLGHLLASPSSCRPRSSSGPCGCGRWCGCAGRGPAAPCGGGPLVAVDLHLALDVLGDVPAQVTLDPEVGVDVGAQAGDLFVGQVADPGVGVDVGRLADLLRRVLPMPKM